MNSVHMRIIQHYLHNYKYKSEGIVTIYIKGVLNSGVSNFYVQHLDGGLWEETFFDDDVLAFIASWFRGKTSLFRVNIS